MFRGPSRLLMASIGPRLCLEWPREIVWPMLLVAMLMAGPVMLTIICGDNWGLTDASAAQAAVEICGAATVERRKR